MHFGTAKPAAGLLSGSAFSYVYLTLDAPRGPIESLALLRFTRSVVVQPSSTFSGVERGNDSQTVAELSRGVDNRVRFLMKHVEQLSYDEMAEITGDGISALKMRVKRACARLRELLEEVHDV